MDLSKRQLLQEALAKAEAHHAYIAVSTPSGTRSCCVPISPVMKLMLKERVPTDSY